MMNQGVVQSSGNPNWWSINNMRPPLHHQLTAQLTPPLTAAASSWNDGHELPDSWSQLLLGGLVGEEDKSIDMIHMQAKKLENWEEQFLKHQSTLNAFGVDVVKQENNSYTYNPARNVEFQMVSASSPKSCVSTLSSSNMFDFSHKTSDVKLPKPDPSSYECNSKGTGGAAKKPRIQSSSAQSTFKVRKEKLGDRITALHQLVSPFGKTDTASVLLEAIGYIRFLQSQIEALSVPYLGSGSGNMSHNNPFGGESNCLFPEDSGQLLNEKGIKRKGLTSSDQACDHGEAKKGLRSRGLCLVPISCTLQVGSDNGADYWAPAFGGN